MYLLPSEAETRVAVPWASLPVRPSFHAAICEMPSIWASGASSVT
ncbi:hypothetical protein ACFQ1I_18410 [Kitasatospora arboriphila]